MGILKSQLKQGSIHTNTLGNYYTYLIHLHTFHSDVLKVNSQQVIKGFQVLAVYLYLCSAITEIHS